MKVKELIAGLKKMPKDLEVYWADHDHNEFEINNQPRRILIVDKRDAKEWHKEALKLNKGYTPDRYVVIRP